LPKGTATNLAAFLPAGTTVDGVNPNLVNPNFWQYIETNGVLSVNQEQTADYHLVEDVFAGHAEVIYRLPQLRVMLGSRLEDTRSTDQTSDVISNVITPVKRDINYTELLPNAQALYDLRPNLRLRAAYTETIARPDFSDFAMGRTTSVDSNGYPVISGTNPYLKPRQSRNYDFSVDYNFRDGFASMGLFRKELRREEFKELTQQTNGQGVIILTETMPLNSGRARMNGVEITVSQDRFWFLPHPLDGLYANANYTRMEGVWKVVFSNGSTRDVDGLRNQPTWLGNLTAGYRLGPIDVSTSVRWRGRTFTGTFGTTAAGDIWYQDYTRVDAHASYKLNSHLSFYVEGRNLNNAYLRQTTGLYNALTSAVDPGPSGFVGVKFKD
jgi:TonB-dependent receptor